MPDQIFEHPTGNVAQAIVDPRDWAATLGDPADRAWREWTRAASYRRTQIAGVGAVETWGEVTNVSGQLVSFRSIFVFAADGLTLTSTSTLRFRDRGEVESTLRAAGYLVVDVRDAPDRPGREFVFLAQRPGGAE